VEQLKKSEDTPASEPSDRDVQMRRLLRDAIDALQLSGPDAAVEVLLKGIAEPEPMPESPKSHEQPLRLRLIEARLRAEVDFDENYLSECIVSVIDQVLVDASHGCEKTTFNLKSLPIEILKEKKPDAGLIERRIAAWFKRNGVKAESFKGELTVYIPDRL